MHYSAYPARAIHHGRFMQFRIYAGERRYIDDRTPAHVLPDAGQYINRLKIGRLYHKIDCIPAKKPYQLVHHPVPWGQYKDNHPRQHDRGYEVGRVGDCLERLFIADAFYFIEHEREYYWNRKADGQLVQADADRVCQHPFE